MVIYVSNPPLILKLIFPIVMLFLGIMFMFFTNLCLKGFYKISELMNNPFAKTWRRETLYGFYKAGGVIFLIAGIVCLIGVFFWGFFS